MKRTYTFILAFMCLTLFAKDYVRVMYFNELFGHIHKNPSRYSQSLSTVGCAHPVKIISDKYTKSSGIEYFKIKAGPYVGYMDGDYLSSKKPKCFQDKYPRFFDSMNLSLTDMYYWGKLYDQYVEGQSKVK